ncbi:MAG: hypothetical protein ACFFDP_03600 [Promethearchaeota archaeon]
MIPELVLTIIVFIISWLIISFVFYLAGRAVSGKNTTFTDAMIVSLLGNIVSSVLSVAFLLFVYPALLPFLGALSALLVLVGVPALITLIVYIWLIMKFFDTGFWGAVAVGLLVIIIWIVIYVFLVAFLLGLLLLLLAWP